MIVATFAPAILSQTCGSVKLAFQNSGCCGEGSDKSAACFSADSDGFVNPVEAAAFMKSTYVDPVTTPIPRGDDMIAEFPWVNIAASKNYQTIYEIAGKNPITNTSFTAEYLDYDNANGKLPTKAPVHSIYSTTKLFGAMATWRLMGMNLMEPDTELYHYFPQMRDTINGVEKAKQMHVPRVYDGTKTLYNVNGSIPFNDKEFRWSATRAGAYPGWAGGAGAVLPGYVYFYAGFIGGASAGIASDSVTPTVAQKMTALQALIDSGEIVVADIESYAIETYNVFTPDLVAGNVSVGKSNHHEWGTRYKITPGAGVLTNTELENLNQNPFGSVPVVVDGVEYTAQAEVKYLYGDVFLLRDSGGECGTVLDCTEGSSTYHHLLTDQDGANMANATFGGETWQTWASPSQTAQGFRVGWIVNSELPCVNSPLCKPCSNTTLTHQCIYKADMESMSFNDIIRVIPRALWKANKDVKIPGPSFDYTPWTENGKFQWNKYWKHYFETNMIPYAYNADPTVDPLFPFVGGAALTPKTMPNVAIEQLKASLTEQSTKQVYIDAAMTSPVLSHFKQSDSGSRSTVFYYLEPVRHPTLADAAALSSGSGEPGSDTVKGPQLEIASAYMVDGINSRFPEILDPSMYETSEINRVPSWRRDASLVYSGILNANNYADYYGAILGSGVLFSPPATRPVYAGDLGIMSIVTTKIYNENLRKPSDPVLLLPEVMEELLFKPVGVNMKWYRTADEWHNLAKEKRLLYSVGVDKYMKASSSTFKTQNGEWLPIINGYRYNETTDKYVEDAVNGGKNSAYYTKVTAGMNYGTGITTTTLDALKLTEVIANKGMYKTATTGKMARLFPEDVLHRARKAPVTVEAVEAEMKKYNPNYKPDWAASFGNLGICQLIWGFGILAGGNCPYPDNTPRYTLPDVTQIRTRWPVIHQVEILTHVVLPPRDLDGLEPSGSLQSQILNPG